MNSPKREAAAGVEIERRIFLLRGQRVMLSPDLAELYGIPAKVLVQAVKRNRQRFPADFHFQLSVEEFRTLKSQFVTSSWGGMRRATPYAFTEQGNCDGFLSRMLTSRASSGSWNVSTTANSRPYSRRFASSWGRLRRRASALAFVATTNPWTKWRGLPARRPRQPWQ